tara:strand:- start:538 stop:747 length:210 start_codon:yes stop_codon:yes gene_type:complete
MNILQQIGTDVKDKINDNKGLVKVVDSETNILARTSDASGTLAFGTDTNKLYIHISSGTWRAISTDSTE